MRISCVANDPGYQAFQDMAKAKRMAMVALDGTLLDTGAVLMADEERGLVRELVLDTDGEVIRMDDGEALTRYRHGRVTIAAIDPKAPN